jgi:hypothetical protein
MVSYDDDKITLKLPRGWESLQHSRPDLLRFRESSGRRMLSVSVMAIDKQEVISPGLHKAVQGIYADRVEAERCDLAAGDPLIADGIQITKDTALGLFSGVRKASGRIFTGYVIARGASVVILYLESITSDQRAHLQLCNEIFKGLTIKPAA